MALKSNGFSLIELMITLSMVAIIMAVAYPSYQGHIRKATRTDAKTGLVDTAARLERFFTENNTYTSNLASLGLSSATSPEGYYLLSAAAGATGDITSSFTVTATQITSNDPDCASLSLSSNGAKAATSADCW